MFLKQVEYISKEAEYSLSCEYQPAIPVNPYSLLLLLLKVRIRPSVHELSHYFQCQSQHLDMSKAQLLSCSYGVKMILLQFLQERMNKDCNIMPKRVLVISQMIYKLDDDLVGSAEDVDLLQQLALDKGLHALLFQRLHDVPHRAVL